MLTQKLEKLLLDLSSFLREVTHEYGDDLIRFFSFPQIIKMAATWRLGHHLELRLTMAEVQMDTSTHLACSSAYAALWRPSWQTSLCQPWWRYHFQWLWFSLTWPDFGTSIVRHLAVERTSRRHLFAVSSQGTWWTHHCPSALQSANDLQFHRLFSLQMQCLRVAYLGHGI